MLLLAEILHHLACTRKILGYSQLVDFSHKQFKGNLDKPNLLGLSASWFGLLIRGFFVGFSENHPNLEPGPGDLIASKNRKEIRVLIRSWMPHGWFTSFWSPDWAVSYRTMGGSGSFLAACMTLKLLVWGKTPSMFYRVWNDLQPADPIWPWLKKIFTSTKSVLGRNNECGTTLNTIAGQESTLCKMVIWSPKCTTKLLPVLPVLFFKMFPF